MRLTGKVAVVTGGGSGFGAAICRRFVDEGAHVVIVDCQADRGGVVAGELGALFVEGDVASAATARQMIQAAVDRFGRLDILVNNAGAAQAPTPVTDTD